MSTFFVFGITDPLAKTLEARKAPKSELEKMVAEDLRRGMLGLLEAKLLC